MMMMKAWKSSTWGIARYIDLLWYCYLIVGVLIIALVAVAFLSGMGTSILGMLYNHLDLPVTTILRADDVAALMHGGMEPGQPGLAVADLQFVYPLDPRTRTITAVGLPAYYLVVLALLFVARELLKSFERGEPFASQSSKRVRQISFLMLALALARSLLLYWNTALYREEFVAAGLKVVGPTIGYPWLILAAIACWVLGSVFDTGTRLREEEQLTI